MRSTIPVPKTKVCARCGEEFAIPYRLSHKQYEARRFCSERCQWDAQIKDRPLCKCGCGERVSSLAVEYLRGHNARPYELDHEIPEDAVRVPLVRRDGSARAWAYVDAEDLDRVSQYRWILHGGYARTTPAGGAGKRRNMHREILGVSEVDPGTVQVDHINHNKLDNRRSNLRLVTAAGNTQNRRKHIGTSKYRNVAYDQRTGRWIVTLRYDGKSHFIGRFTNEDEAGRAAAEARRKHLPFAID